MHAPLPLNRGTGRKTPSAASRTASLKAGETAEQLGRFTLEVAPGEVREAPSCSRHCSTSVVSKKTSSTVSHS